jgi:hypothetical protein
MAPQTVELSERIPEPSLECLRGFFVLALELKYYAKMVKVRKQLLLVLLDIRKFYFSPTIQ